MNKEIVDALINQCVHTVRFLCATSQQPNDQPDVTAQRLGMAADKFMKEMQRVEDAKTLSLQSSKKASKTED